MKEYIRRVIKTIIMSIITVFVIIAFVRQESTGINIEEASIVSDNFSKVVDASVIEKNQSSIYKKGTYNSLYEIKGQLTGYSAQCRGCTGWLACKSAQYHKYIYVGDGTTMYHDTTYGDVRIVAANRKYPCGTILRFNVKKISSEPIYAIVLDRGGILTEEVFDFLVESEDYAIKKIGRVRNVTFEVVREGWKK